MTKEDIINNNELIAKFMGVERQIQGGNLKIDQDFYYDYFLKIPNEYNVNWVTKENLKYHCNWNWLIPVIDKLGKVMKAENELALYAYVRIYDNHIFTSTIIEQVWEDVIRLIKLYNNKE